MRRAARDDRAGLTSMDAFLPGTAKVILLGLITIVIVLGALARRFPGVRWLRVFRLPEHPMTEEQRERMRRLGNRQGGMEMLLAGTVIALVSLLSNIMFFADTPTGLTVLVGAGSLLCIGLGITTLVRNR